MLGRRRGGTQGGATGSGWPGTQGGGEGNDYEAAGSGPRLFRGLLRLRWRSRRKWVIVLVFAVIGTYRQSYSQVGVVIEERGIGVGAIIFRGAANARHEAAGPEICRAKVRYLDRADKFRLRDGGFNSRIGSRQSRHGWRDVVHRRRRLAGGAGPERGTKHQYYRRAHIEAVRSICSLPTLPLPFSTMRRGPLDSPAPIGEEAQPAAGCRAREAAEAVTGCQPDTGSLFPSLVLGGSVMSN
jgi:hypothetical protein